MLVVSFGDCRIGPIHCSVYTLLGQSEMVKLWAWPSDASGLNLRSNRQMRVTGFAANKRVWQRESEGQRDRNGFNGLMLARKFNILFHFHPNPFYSTQLAKLGRWVHVRCWCHNIYIYIYIIWYTIKNKPTNIKKERKMEEQYKV